MAWPTKASESKNPEVVALAGKALEILEVALAPIYQKTVVEGKAPIYDELKTVGFIMGVLKDVSNNIEADTTFSKLDDEELLKLAKKFIKVKAPKDMKVSTEV